jgi:hypothetical protein
MEKISNSTSVRFINGWLEIKRTSCANEKYIHIKTQRIVYLSREGPFGDYDEDDDAIEVWHVNIIVERPNEGKWVKHTVVLPFTSEAEAESFLMAINAKIY